MLSDIAPIGASARISNREGVLIAFAIITRIGPGRWGGTFTEICYQASGPDKRPFSASTRYWLPEGEGLTFEGLRADLARFYREHCYRPAA